MKLSKKRKLVERLDSLKERHKRVVEKFGSHTTVAKNLMEQIADTRKQLGWPPPNQGYPDA